ncbi:Methyl-accepting chemotaxis protein [Andreprevotia lacus DSM 23236]|jgi:methyl-accepting chemotaxis protein|uniref:Methyl-accepting chemotaxis protein n=1 Tax=Andreprevotia lacus DSM 23236 TaxID=1121001 RepID=A0A1W1XI82_9NEIS|nr:Cache 3/Cache 2 fusion domain-containing protein [Andreprevotia lacus]SMC23670.1 Methyl-accepting chemotaxis protein [Andreprevotia lacus DSM 23236]
MPGFTLRHRPIVEQIAMLTIIVCVLVFAALIAMTSLSVNRVALDTAQKGLSDQLELVKGSLKLAYEGALLRSEGTMELFQKQLPGEFAISAETQATGSAGDAPLVKAGELVINGNTDILERLKRETGAEAAVIARTSAGKFVRITTLLKDKDGKSMLGSSIKADDPILQAITGGHDYLGLVMRNDHYYLTRARPIKNPGGEIAGWYQTRIDLSRELATLGKVIDGIKVGKTGYVYILAADKDKVARFIIHPQYPGKYAGDVLQGDALSTISHLVTQKTGTYRYDWPNPDQGNRPAAKIVVFSAVPDWNWVVASGSFLDEFTADSVALRNRLIVACVIFGALILVLLYLALKSRLKPLASVVGAVDRFGAGDLSARIDIPAEESSRNEIAQLTLHFNHAAERLQALIGEIRSTADAVDGTARNMGDAVEQVASSSMRQSESASSMAATVEQITVSIGHIADTAGSARQAGQSALEASKDGRRLMERTVEEMQRIATAANDASGQISRLGERSSEISSIVGVIKEIADQTNLLALNAAIEAARAGEQGRGFAVVADEVRKLAERTSASTQQISQLVGGIVGDTQQVAAEIVAVSSQMREGVQSVEETGSVLERIHSEADRVFNVLQDIAEATREQTVASSQLARGVENVAHSAEANASIAQRNSGSASDLREQARVLHDKLDQFTI